MIIVIVILSLLIIYLFRRLKQEKSIYKNISSKYSRLQKVQHQSEKFEDAYRHGLLYFIDHLGVDIKHGHIKIANLSNTQNDCLMDFLVEIQCSLSDQLHINDNNNTIDILSAESYEFIVRNPYCIPYILDLTFTCIDQRSFNSSTLCELSTKAISWFKYLFDQSGYSNSSWKYYQFDDQKQRGMQDEKV